MRLAKAFLILLLPLVGAACSVPGPGEAPDGIYDPHEAVNRRVHTFNRGLDKSALRPVSKGYVSVVPDEVQTVVGNFAENLTVPGDVVNQVLQGRLDRAVKNTLRFAINTTVGLAGTADFAKDFGLPEDETDFGETLYVWGVAEGAYMELPMLGPSTERDAVGTFVGFFINPLDYVLPAPEKYVGTAARGLAYVGKRGKFGDTVDSVLYDSADSYAQARIIYLQNRRFELGAVQQGSYIVFEEIDTEGF